MAGSGLAAAALNWTTSDLLELNFKNLFKVRAGVYGRLMAGSGLAAAANWTTSDLL